jgi:Tfp pilus assembly protein PilF
MIINPDFVPALVDMGGLKAEKGDFVKAEKFLFRATTLEPLNATAHYNLAQVYQMQGKNTAAEEEMKKANKAEALSQQKTTVPRQ